MIHHQIVAGGVYTVCLCDPRNYAVREIAPDSLPRQISPRRAARLSAIHIDPYYY